MVLLTRVKCKAMGYLPGVMVLATTASTRTIRSMEKVSIHHRKGSSTRVAGKTESGREKEY